MESKQKKTVKATYDPNKVMRLSDVIRYALALFDQVGDVPCFVPNKDKPDGVDALQSILPFTVPPKPPEKDGSKIVLFANYCMELADAAEQDTENKAD